MTSIPLSWRPIGAIAQLVEHLHGMQGVSGSNPLGSIHRTQAWPGFFNVGLFWKSLPRPMLGKNLGKTQGARC
jgi:hypothetical protein